MEVYEKREEMEVEAAVWWARQGVVETWTVAGGSAEARPWWRGRRRPPRLPLRTPSPPTPEDNGGLAAPRAAATVLPSPSQPNQQASGGGGGTPKAAIVVTFAAAATVLMPLPVFASALAAGGMSHLRLRHRCPSDLRLRCRPPERPPPPPPLPPPVPEQPPPPPLPSAAIVGATVNVPQYGYFAAVLELKKWHDVIADNVRQMRPRDTSSAAS